MENTPEYELVVSQGRRHFLENALAAVFFSAILYMMGRTIYFAVFEPYWPAFLYCLFELFSKGLFCLALALGFATVKTVLIDVDLDKLISKYTIGPFHYSRVSSVPVLEYVAVFLNPKDYYEVNLWYKGNKHYKMYQFETKKEAFRLAEMVSKKLNLDLLDATERGNSKWMERPAP